MQWNRFNTTRFSPAKIFCTALLSAFALSALPAFAQHNNAQSGVTEGTLVAKGEAWISVRADGEKEPVKLMPLWIGGLPRNGGGLDKRMLAAFRELKTGTRLKIAWLRDEHLRVTDIQVLPAREEGAAGNDEAGNGDAHNGDNAQQPRSGDARGVVTAKGENWISIRGEGDKEPTKLIPRWIGGLPKDGGGFDKQMLQLIAQTPVGARVRVEWVFQEHMRVVVLKRLD